MHRLVRLVTAATAVAAVATTAAPAGAAPSVPTYFLKDSGRSITVTKGTNFRLDLRTIVSAGYQWGVTTHFDASKVGFISRTLKPFPHQPGQTGYPYHTVYLWKGVGKGTTSVRIKERNASHSSTLAQFTLTVTVK